MTRIFGLVAGVSAIVAAIVAWSALYTVHETEQALVFQFGAPIAEVREPGLHMKVPFIQNVVYYDNRVLDFAPPAEEIIASDQKRRSEEHTSELQSLMRISYAVFCLKKKKTNKN